MLFKRRPLPAAEVNLTPLIDVVFLLLIFFVLTTRLPEHLLEIELPSLANPSRPSADSSNEVLVINIFADQRLSLANQPLANLDELKQQLLALQATNNQPLTLRLRAEATTPAQQLVNLLELLQSLNLTAIEFSTQPTLTH